jgi:hypothetical protein
MQFVSLLFAVVADEFKEGFEQLIPYFWRLPCARSSGDDYMEVGFRAASGHSSVDTSLTSRLEVMYELLWRACCGQDLERYGRRFLVIFGLVLDDVENLISVLKRS